MKEYPKTIDEAVDFVISEMSEEVRDKMKQMHEDELIGFHFSLGTWIRNNLGLWGDNNELLESKEFLSNHPDDISMEIIKAVWEKLTG